ncbi:sodium- and chloride-dependent glycine transporter 1-like isoform X3 [Acanthaster planci]|uniref:Transporter n=1 Tax=Acanthaster planci TaxID=133434 RepID=A0A8B7YZZ4_ACAPL|nr:sodium- and chloride-dependent glycine transporter 1-like isoform X3 [Acanthaster planci]
MDWERSKCKAAERLLVTRMKGWMLGNKTRGGEFGEDIQTEDFSNEEEDMDKEKKLSGNGYEVIAVDTVTTTNPVIERGNWGRQLDYILSCVGYAVGLGNIWRFPYLCYRHGGGVFLIPYIIMLFLAGMPLFFLETAFGQYASQGPVTIWRACPLFAGIGWAMVIISAMVVIYYNIIMAWTAFFIFKSFTLELPWQHCNNTWNTDDCGYASPPNGTMFNGTWLNQTMAEMMNISVPKAVTPAEEYWNKIVLDKSDGIENLGPVRWQMALCLLLSWVVVFLCICRGVKSSGKVVYFTATFPYIILICLLIRALTLEGASEGIGYYMNADWKQLKKSKVWNDAASQIFYSLGPAWGGILTFSSYNKFNHNCFRDAIMVPIINCSTSIFAGFVVFATLGFMSAKTGMDIEHVAVQGPGLVFVTYPEAIAQMPAAPLWSFLFFFMLFLVGLDTQFGMTETVISGFIDQFPEHLRKWKTLFALGVCCLFFLLGLPLVTRGGIYVFELINWYSAWISLMIVGMTECFAIAYFYGFRRFISDIKKMLGYETVVWWWYCICWLFVTPAVILFIIGFGIYQYVPVYYGDSYYPPWSEALGWVMALIAPLMIPIFMVVNFLRSEGNTILEKLRNVIRPTKEWDLAHDHSPENSQVDVPMTQCKMATSMNGNKPGQAV